MGRREGNINLFKDEDCPQGMNPEDKKLEIAKSYFELSKIFATLVGFLIIASSLFLQIAFLNLEWFNESSNAKNISYAGFYANLFWVFFFISFVFMILSFIKWKKGKRIIKTI